MSRRFQHNRNDAGSLLASVFIVVLGSGCCLFLVAAMSPASFVKTALGLSGTCAVFLILIILQRFRKTPGSSVDFLFSSTSNRRDDGLKDYEPRKAGGNQSPSPVGTNHPISAQEAHEINVTSANTWVPANSARNRKNSD